MKKLIKEMLEDSTGGTSTSRVVALIAVVTVFSVWAVASIIAAFSAYKTGTPLILPTIPTEIGLLVLGCAGQKVAQRIWGEKPESP